MRTTSKDTVKLFQSRNCTFNMTLEIANFNFFSSSYKYQVRQKLAASVTPLQTRSTQNTCRVIYRISRQHAITSGNNIFISTFKTAPSLRPRSYQSILERDVFRSQVQFLVLTLVMEGTSRGYFLQDLARFWLN